MRRKSVNKNSHYVYPRHALCIAIVALSAYSCKWVWRSIADQSLLTRLPQCRWVCRQINLISPIMTLAKKSFVFRSMPMPSLGISSLLSFPFKLLGRTVLLRFMSGSKFFVVALWSVRITALCCGTVQANDAARTEQLEVLFDQSGVELHLANVLATVATESSETRQGCRSSKSSEAIEKELENLLSATALRTAFLGQMDDRISESQLAQIMMFINSDVGQRVYKADVNSSNLDDESFSTLLATLKRDGVLSEERGNAMKQMIADTGAVYFLSALNTELSTLVIMASVCSNSERDIEQAELEIRKERGSEALYRSFMRQELLIPAMIVYRELSISEIEQVSEFAKSDAGNTYYASLIQGLRTVLNVKVGELNMAIRDMPKEN